MTRPIKFIPSDCEVAGSHTGDTTSFAHITATTRWSVIIRQAAADVLKTVDEGALYAEDEDKGRNLAARIENVAKAIEANDLLSPLEDDGAEDIASYNAELKFLATARWADAPWLFTECYMYRLLRTFFALAGAFWSRYDIFARQKDAAFIQSKAAVEELAARYTELVGELEQHKAAAADPVAQSLLFDDMLQIALWGNGTDLSLLTNLSFEDIKKLQGKAAIQESRKNIVSDDTDSVWNVMKGLQGGRIDIVLDNAGFELYADLIFATYLLEAGYASSVVLHPKNFPWFVSDVLVGDVKSLFSLLEDPAVFVRRPEIDFLRSRWQTFFDSGKISLHSDGFWTTQGSFWRLKALAPSLYAELAKSDLVIFKGDLNYRKLVADGMWPHTTSFPKAIGADEGDETGNRWDGIRVLSLRTCKADVCVGLSSEEQMRKVVEESNGTWTRTGKYAVISFYDGKGGRN